MEVTDIRLEGLQDNEGFKKAVETILGGIGEDPKREGLRRTPLRFAKAFEELCGGYSKTPKDVLDRDFESDGYDQIITVGGIRFFSMCEHHILPFFGHVWVSYLPDKRVIGLDKIPKLVEIFARRLQIQERMTEQIADSLWQHLRPKGVMVVVKAHHFCMEMRGVKQSCPTMTSSLKGLFLKSPTLKEEVFEVLKHSENY